MASEQQSGLYCGFESDSGSDYRIDIAASTSGQAWRLRLAAGLDLDEEGVLLAMGAFVDIESGLTSVQLSIRELTGMLSPYGINKGRVERAMVRLAGKGMIARHQASRRDRSISVTTLLPPALALIGLGHATPEEVAKVMPAGLRGLLLGEDAEVIAEVNRAWVQGVMPAASVAGQYRGGGEGWSRIEAILSRSIEADVAAIEAAVEAVELRCEEKRVGRYQLVLSDDVSIVVDGAAIEAESVTPCDVGLAVDVLRTAEAVRPGVLTAENIALRLAEALYSRHVGFASRMDAERAVAVIGRTMTRDSWCKPFGIREDWYQLTLAHVAGYPEVSQSAPSNSVCF